MAKKIISEEVLKIKEENKKKVKALKEEVTGWKRLYKDAMGRMAELEEKIKVIFELKEENLKLKEENLRLKKQLDEMK